jgi:ligand-binding sensor protein
LAGYVVIEKQLELEISNAKSFLDEDYQDILENFDPNVVKLRKKRKVIMSARVLDDLEKLSHDDDPTE